MVVVGAVIIACLPLLPIVIARVVETVMNIESIIPACEVVTPIAEAHASSHVCHIAIKKIG